MSVGANGADTTLVLRAVTQPGRPDHPVDITIAGGRITSITDAGTDAGAGAGPSPAGTEHLDLAGYVLLPAFVEPHAHLDKALSADVAPNPAGDLMGAIDAWHLHREALTVEEITGRAERAVEIALRAGVTAIRTHVDVAPELAGRPVDALVAIRQRFAGRLHLEIVALTTSPVTGAAGAGNRAALRDALARGADVVGGCPHLDGDPHGSTDVFLEIAAEAGRPLDLHTDENLRVDSLDLLTFAQRVRAAYPSGHPFGATASHCVSLGMQPVERQHEVAAAVAEAGIAVVTLPQTNLFLQSRDRPVAPPRGLTALRPLLAAGVVVAGGGDNLQDPFNSVGRGDPLETAALLVMAGHLLPDEALHSVSGAGRAALRLEAVRVEVGAPADLVAIKAGSAREALASAPADRVVLHGGRVVSRTRTVHDE